MMVLFTVFAVLLQATISQKGYFVAALFFALSFTAMIVLLFIDYHFVVYLLLTNFCFYLMAAASYFQRTSY